MPSEIGHYEEGTMKRALLRRGHMKSDSTMEFYSPLFDQSDPLVSVSNYCGEIELHGDFDPSTVIVLGLYIHVPCGKWPCLFCTRSVHATSPSSSPCTAVLGHGTLPQCWLSDVHDLKHSPEVCWPFPVGDP